MTDDGLEAWKQEEFAYVKKNGKRMIGKAQYLRFLRGEYLSFKDCISAQCFTCQNYGIDGIQSCDDMMCPLYPAINRIRQSTKSKK